PIGDIIRASGCSSRPRLAEALSGLARAIGDHAPACDHPPQGEHLWTGGIIYGCRGKLSAAALWPFRLLNPAVRCSGSPVYGNSLRPCTCRATGSVSAHTTDRSASAALHDATDAWSPKGQFAHRACRWKVAPVRVLLGSR